MFIFMRQIFLMFVQAIYFLSTNNSENYNLNPIFFVFLIVLATASLFQHLYE